MINAGTFPKLPGFATGGRLQWSYRWQNAARGTLADAKTDLRAAKNNLKFAQKAYDQIDGTKENRDAKKAAKAEWQPHTEIVYHLFSMKHKHSLVLKVILPRWKEGRPGELPEVPSVSGIWSTADWHEREVYDLNGVYFTGHPNLRRILCPEDWVGHPLRKDYEMPLEYHGIRGR